MSRIEDAVNGADHRMRDFLKSEGFEYSKHNIAKWKFKTTDPEDRPVEVDIYDRNIYAVVYKQDGSGEIFRSENFYFESYEEFYNAYESMLEYLRS